MTIEQLTRVTGYPWYGSGGHQSLGAPPYVFTIQGYDLINRDGKWVSTIRATHRHNLRLFVDSRSIVPETTSTNQSFTIRLNPTEQNFFYDDFLRLLDANGRTAIICPSGLFDWLVVSGYSQRKSACYDHSMSPSNPAAWKDFAHLFKLLAEYFKDKPYDVTLQGGNELDFRWNVMKELTPEEIAVGQWEVIKAITAVNPEQKIMLGCTLNPSMATFNRYVGKLEQLAQAEGRTLPQGLIWSDNNYVRDSGGNQGGGLADTPESQWTQTHDYRVQLNAACQQRGMKWEITEHGYSNSTSTSFAALKQKAPALQGVSHDEAPGVLWFRSMLMYASFSECVGVSRYHDKDGFEAEPFTYIGINYDKDFGGKEDWSDKPCKIYYEGQLDLFEKLDVVKYHRANGIYYAEFENGQILHWTDKVNIGTVTPKPTLTTTIPPTEPPVEPPNPPTMRNAYLTATASAPYGNFQLTEGISTTPGKYAIYVDGEPPVTLELFKDGVSFIPKRTENGKPLAVGGDDNGVLRLKDFPAGSYKLVMNTEVINFTVGTVTPPPTGDIAGTSFALKPNGQIEFVFANGVKKLVNAV